MHLYIIDKYLEARDKDKIPIDEEFDRDTKKRKLIPRESKTKLRVFTRDEVRKIAKEAIDKYCLDYENKEVTLNSIFVKLTQIIGYFVGSKYQSLLSFLSKFCQWLFTKRSGLMLMILCAVCSQLFFNN
jgi:hypothetical protein